MKKSFLKKGFTLIELLVVIAIIGILSGIVLTSLGSARTKARDSSAIASMSSMRSQAELSVTSSGTYPSDLFTDSGKLGNLVIAVQNQTGHNVTSGLATDGSAWAAQVQLSGTSGQYFCVDSKGNASSSASTFGVTSVAPVKAYCF